MGRPRKPKREQAREEERETALPTDDDRADARAWLERADPELAALMAAPGTRAEGRAALAALNAARRATQRAAPDDDLARWERLMTPALSEQEWDDLIPADAREMRRQGHATTDAEWRDALATQLASHVTALAQAKRWDAILAIATYALPDDHPGKLTRADVEAALDPTGDGFAVLAAKIASHLPPETEDGE